MQTETKIHRLDNGLRLATVSMPHMASVSMGFWTDVGSRHERPDEHGMAHFVEHLLFKGTPTRSAEDISRQIEGIGGSIDGFTVEDHTCYHTRAPADKFEPLLDVIADFYQNPVFDPKEIESERRVIREEIAMVKDLPSQYVEDLISEAAMGVDHPLGRSITGTIESITQFTRDDVFDFFNQAYTGKHTVISIAGNIDHDIAAKAVRERLKGMRSGGEITFDPAPSKDQFGHVFGEIPSREQAHIALAFRSADRYDPARYAQKLLNVILGENMSSRLFQILREQKGLCYEVQSDGVAFSDAGLLQIYLALDPSNLEETLHSISGIMKDLCQNGVTDSELEEAKSYISGQSRIGLESTASQMMWAGECLITFDDQVDPEHILEKLNAVTVEEVREAARSIFQSGTLSTALAGSYDANSILCDWAAHT